jgi:hypothetical protein
MTMMIQRARRWNVQQARVTVLYLETFLLLIASQAYTVVLR